MNSKRIGWASIEEVERAIRMKQAQGERMDVHKLCKGKDVLRDYEVATGTGAVRDMYRMEMRTLGKSSNWCSCPDFAKSGLGMCKHLACMIGESDKFITSHNTLHLSDADALTLHCAIQGQNTGDAPDRTSAFLSLCREKLGG